MSPFAQKMLEYFVDGALVIAFWVVILAPVGWVLFSGLKWILPEGLRAAVVRLFEIGESDGDPVDLFLTRQAAVHRRTLGGNPVRIIVERQHKTLEARLRSIRASFGEGLMRLSAGAAGSSAPTLIGLLRSFKDDVNRQNEFGLISDDLVDNTKALKVAKHRLIFGAVYLIVTTAVNSGLLFVFLRDMRTGVQLPFTHLDVMVVFAIFIPIIEFGAGFSPEFYADDEASKRSMLAKKWVFLAVMMLVEAVIFGLLFYNVFENLEISPENQTYGLVVVGLLALFGPVLAMFQAQSGSNVGSAMKVRSTLTAERTIKEHVREANKFVVGLPERFDGIASHARAAVHAVDQLAVDLQGTESANLPIVSAVEEQRTLLLRAVDNVNPTRWSGQIPGNDADEADVGRLAWLMPVFVAVLGIFFVILVSGFLARAHLAGLHAPWVRYAAAIVSAAACFIVGQFVFQRIGTATIHGSEVRDTLFPRNEAMRFAGFGVVGVIIVAMLCAGYMADGGTGLILGAVAGSIGIGLALLGSFQDMVARGVSFLAMSAVISVVMIFDAAWALVRKTSLGLAALVLTILWWVVFLMGVPILVPQHLIRRERATRVGAAQA
jgi:hypothetical protein